MILSPYFQKESEEEKLKRLEQANKRYNEQEHNFQKRLRNGTVEDQLKLLISDTTLAMNEKEIAIMLLQDELSDKPMPAEEVLRLTKSLVDSGLCMYQIVEQYDSNAVEEQHDSVYAIEAILVNCGCYCGWYISTDMTWDEVNSQFSLYDEKDCVQDVRFNSYSQAIRNLRHGFSTPSISTDEAASLLTTIGLEGDLESMSRFEREAAIRLATSLKDNKP